MLPILWKTAFLLICSNVFMTFARQAVMLFPVLDAGTFVALHTPFAFMQHTGHCAALAYQVQDPRDTSLHLG